MEPIQQMTSSASWKGRSAERRIVITADLVARFASLSGDTSAIHVDDASARSKGFRERVAHGMLLASLVSGIIGTELPGHDGVLHQVRLSFRNPCYPGDCLHIRVEVQDFIESVQTLILKVRITNQNGVTILSGDIQSGVTHAEA